MLEPDATHKTIQNTSALFWKAEQLRGQGTEFVSK